MSESTLAVLQIVGRLSVVYLCYYAVTKMNLCTKNCVRWRHEVRRVLGWMSGAVACVGLFYPVVCGVAALVLIVALWAAEFDYAKETHQVRSVSKASSVGDARS